jgi:GTP-binding protein
LKITACRFERAACRSEDEPTSSGPVVVFFGRSNVGKSSLLNALLGVKGLARTSSRPGRTQEVHFYRVNEAFYFVDLPGYGFAAAPESVRRSWKPMIDGFLARWKERIALGVLVVDARHEPTELDSAMRHWLQDSAVDYAVAATKADKLSGNERAAARRRLQAWVGLDGLPAAPILLSATGAPGIGELWSRIDRALTAAPRTGQRGTPWISAN